MSRHLLSGHPDVREVRVPVATVWTSPDAPRDIDAPAVHDDPDVAAWTASMDAETRLDLHGRTLTQLLLGEAALVLEARDGWTKVAALHQQSSTHPRGYPGWVRTAHLGTPVDRTDGATVFVTAPSATLTLDGGGSVPVSCGTGLWGADAGDGSSSRAAAVLLPDGRRGTIPLDAVRCSDKGDEVSFTPEDVLATARQFLGLRYLWGGTSAWGLDCSGLVHLSYRAHRRLVPRDAFDQADWSELEKVDLDDVRPGDLYFFARPGERVYHVGFVTRPVQAAGTRWMLHAPEGGGLIEDAPMAAERVQMLVAAGRVLPQ